MDQENSKKIFVIGVGNLLLGDEGIGIHLIQAMKKERLPRYVELVDGGTAGIDLLYWLEEADYAIIVDCVEAGAEPGAIFRVPGDELLIKSKGQLISLHDINLSEVLLLATKMNKLPPTIIFGIQPEAIGYQTELSPTLQNTLPRLMQLIKKEILKIFA
ncbi:Hydrogenase 2 maturation protease [Pelotomaculum sp. FP]|uniref:HyaD/HybD family hydrogenase maturation endopeptidase n=1 Tax=Pelotomaculum sp. FP TaxID=261474 RepID=UPI001066C5D9|nr:HyaD/HybD family hydrogenase maturation endopeptidase [Pelotomaculum sp. FP]TEB12845.1 Hydrogenase 2 maturation protease [Pelotomaculum sp. FP]